MRLTSGLLLLLALSVGIPSVKAQTEYFTNGKAGAGSSVSFLGGSGQNGFGVEFELMGSPRVGGTLSYAKTSVEQSGGSFGDDTSFDVSAVGFGVQFFPGRQGIDGPLTIGLGFGLGLISEVDATTLNVGLLGRFKRSSQRGCVEQWLCGPIVGTHPAPRPAFASSASCVVEC